MKDITNDGVANGHEPTHVEETSEVGQSDHEYNGNYQLLEKGR